MSIHGEIWIAEIIYIMEQGMMILICHSGFSVNSSPPSAVYMHQWIRSTLVQIMACCLFGTRPLSELMMVFVNWTLQWNFNQSIKFFIQENASENIVCKMAAILSRRDELIFLTCSQLHWYATNCLLWTQLHVSNTQYYFILLTANYFTTDTSYSIKPQTVI